MKGEKGAPAVAMRQVLSGRGQRSDGWGAGKGWSIELCV